MHFNLFFKDLTTCKLSLNISFEIKKVFLSLSFSFINFWSCHIAIGLKYSSLNFLSKIESFLDYFFNFWNLLNEFKRIHLLRWKVYSQSQEDSQFKTNHSNNYHGSLPWLATRVRTIFRWDMTWCLNSLFWLLKIHFRVLFFWCWHCVSRAGTAPTSATDIVFRLLSALRSMFNFAADLVFVWCKINFYDFVNSFFKLVAFVFKIGIAEINWRWPVAWCFTILNNFKRRWSISLMVIVTGDACKERANIDFWISNLTQFLVH